jgi:hypothetical protein
MCISTCLNNRFEINFFNFVLYIMILYGKIICLKYIVETIVFM